MGDYTGAKCTICEKPFVDGDDIVVCPVCGTPYHRACYQVAGKCTNESLHERHEDWSRGAEQEREEQKFDGSALLRCSKCGTVNPQNGIFCQICGSRLNTPQAGEERHSGQDEAPPGGGFIPNPIPLNAYTTPYGGVSPDEALDGVPVRDIALFVGQNSHYFIPRFRDHLKGGRLSAWNWSALLFRGFYFLYRKMYAVGIGLILLEFIIGLPALLFNLGIAFGSQTVLGFSLSDLNRVALVCNVLSLGLSLSCSIFSNRLYCRHVLSRIRRLGGQYPDTYQQDFVMALTKKGRTNRMLIVVLLCGTFVVSLLSSFYLVMNVV